MEISVRSSRGNVAGMLVAVGCERGAIKEGLYGRPLGEGRRRKVRNCARVAAAHPGFWRGRFPVAEWG